MTGTAIEVTAAKNGGFVVERKICGVTSQRYFTNDLTQPRKSLPWSERVAELFGQEPANIVIEVPEVPNVACSVFERIELVNKFNEMLIAENKTLKEAVNASIDRELAEVPSPDLSSLQDPLEIAQLGDENDPPFPGSVAVAEPRDDEYLDSFADPAAEMQALRDQDEHDAKKENE